MIKPMVALGTSLQRGLVALIATGLTMRLNFFPLSVSVKNAITVMDSRRLQFEAILFYVTPLMHAHQAALPKPCQKCPAAYALHW